MSHLVYNGNTADRPLGPPIVQLDASFCVRASLFFQRNARMARRHGIERVLTPPTPALSISASAPNVAGLRRRA